MTAFLAPELAASASVALVVGGALLAVAWDVRARIVPNALNAALGASGALLALAAGVFSPEYALFVAVAFAFAYALYRLGVWAGGDAKFFTALSAHVIFLAPPGSPHQSLLAIPWVFLNAALVTAPVVLALHARDAWALRRDAASLAVSSAREAVRSAVSFTPLVFFFNQGVLLAAPALANVPFVPLALLVAFLALSFLVSLPLPLALVLLAVALALNPVAALASFLAFGVVAFAARFVVSFAPVFAARALRRRVPVAALEEGMILAESVVERGGRAVLVSPPSLRALAAAALTGDASRVRVLLSPPGRLVASAFAARGLSAAEIQALKSLSGVTSVTVKESVAFAPILALGFALSLVWWLP